MYERYKTAEKKFWHPMSASAAAHRGKTLVIARGDGNHITDIDGNRLLDGVGGLWNVNVGHNRAEVKAAIAAQLDELAYYQTFDGIAHPRVFDLADRLTAMFAQERMTRVLFNSGGSDAVETALKMARQYWIAAGQPGRTRFLSLRNGYHGVHIGGTSVGGNGVYHYNHGPLLGGCHLLDTPWLYRNPWDCRDPEQLVEHCIRQLEEQIALLGAQTIAAFIAEPVQGAGGVIVPPATYWKRLREVCDRHEILLIADEVVTGFGRSGCMLGSRGWGVAPTSSAWPRASPPATSPWVPRCSTSASATPSNTAPASATWSCTATPTAGIPPPAPPPWRCWTSSKPRTCPATPHGSGRRSSSNCCPWPNATTWWARCVARG